MKRVGGGAKRAPPLCDVAYDVLFGAPVVARAMHRFGIVSTSHTNARRARAMRAAAAVFPVDAYEVFRPRRRERAI